MFRFLIFEDIVEDTMWRMAAFLQDVPDNSEVLIEITSHGGLVFYGSAITQKIQEARSRGVKFTAKVYGVAASSAADIVLVCDRIEMASTAALMIHSARNDSKGEDEGITIANEAQLAIIRKRLPGYTVEDLQTDRWFKAKEALDIGLIDSIFDVDSNSYAARLCAKYLNTCDGGYAMDEKKDQVVEPEKAEEMVEEKVEEEKVEKEDSPSIEELFERISERFDAIEERIRQIEEARAECGDRRDNARMKAVYEKIAAVSKPCVSCDSVIQVKKENPKAELDKCKATWDLDRLVGND